MTLAVKTTLNLLCLKTHTLRKEMQNDVLHIYEVAYLSPIYITLLF